MDRTFSRFANARLSENCHQAVRFHFQVLNQLVTLKIYTEMIKTQPAAGLCVFRNPKRSCCGEYLPDGVKLCSPWHRIFARFGLEDLIVVHRFPVHDREREGTRLISLSHSRNRETPINQISCFILGHRRSSKVILGHPGHLTHDPGSKQCRSSLCLKGGGHVTASVSLSRLDSDLGGGLRPWVLFQHESMKLTGTFRPAGLHSKAASRPPGGGCYRGTKASSHGR